MDPLRRLHYLEVTGITQYVARTRLPGAKPSPVLERPRTTVTAETPETLIALPETQPKPTASTLLAAAKNSIPDAGNTVAPVYPAAASAQRTVAQPPATKTAFQCQLAFWCVNDLLVLADMPRLENTHVALLNDILFAIQRDKVAAPEAFQWPSGKIKDSSLTAARDYFQGMLEAGLLQKGNVRQILAFGDDAAQLLQQVTHTEQETLAERFHDWPLVILPALHAMIETPANKARAWKQLSPLVTVK